MNPTITEAAGHDVLEVRVPVCTVWTGPDAAREVDHPAVQDDPDVGAWTASMDAAVRKGLNGRTLTQLLMGEPVRVVEEHGDWVRVVAASQPSSADEAGYPGWVRRSHLGPAVTRAPGPSAAVVSRTATVDLEAGGVAGLSFGTVLPVEEVRADAAVVLLPGDRRARVALDDVALTGQQPADPADVLATARRFLGLRYLWGGTSGWGLDCSGLVHLVYRAHGQVVARDAFDQADEMQPVPLDSVQPGDLYFFARPDERIYHVGFVTRPAQEDGTRWMLHAPESGEFIEDALLAPHRRETLVSAARIRTTDLGSAAEPDKE